MATAPPQPLDSRVQLEKMPGRVALVDTFSGSSSTEKAKHRAWLGAEHDRKATEARVHCAH